MANKKNEIVQFPSNAKEEMVSLSPTVVINALKCIDTSAQRGAFYGGELTAVGGVRDALYASVEPILKELEKQQKAEEAANETDED